jgi:hypothetical protein
MALSTFDVIALTLTILSIIGIIYWFWRVEVYADQIEYPDEDDFIWARMIPIRHEDLVLWVAIGTMAGLFFVLRYDGLSM